jgi:hypothetical protein
MDPHSHACLIYLIYGAGPSLLLLGVEEAKALVQDLCQSLPLYRMAKGLILLQQEGQDLVPIRVGHAGAEALAHVSLGLLCEASLRGWRGNA